MEVHLALSADHARHSQIEKAEVRNMVLPQDYLASSVDTNVVARCSVHYSQQYHSSQT